MGQLPQKEPMDVEASWKSESKLSVAQRRTRYRCGPRFVQVDKIPLWENEATTVLKENGPRKIEDARNAERERRKAKKRKEKDEKLDKEEAEQKAKLDQERANSKEEVKEQKEETVAEKKEEQKGVEKKEQKDEMKEEKSTEKKEEKIEAAADQKPDQKMSMSAFLATETKEQFQARMRIQRRERKRREVEEGRLEVEELEIPLAKYAYNKEINQKVSLIRTDITTLEIDAIVNAANKSLLGGGGIDGAIHAAAGEMLYEECRTLEGAETGETKVTRGYNLPAKLVFHTVGPVGRDEPKLVAAYQSCLERVLEHNIKSIALCGISSGIYGYPLNASAHVALNMIRKWLENTENRNKVDLIIFCTYLPKELSTYQKLMPFYFPPPGKSTDDVVKEYKEIMSTYNPVDESLDREEKVLAERKIKRKQEDEERRKRVLGELKLKEEQKPTVAKQEQPKPPEAQPEQQQVKKNP